MARKCQRPGCEKLVRNREDRFCSATHQREDYNERKAAKRAKEAPTPENIAKAKRLLRRNGLCVCEKCDGACRIKKSAKPRKKAAKPIPAE